MALQVSRMLRVVVALKGELLFSEQVELRCIGASTAACLVFWAPPRIKPAREWLELVLGSLWLQERRGSCVPGR